MTPVRTLALITARNESGRIAETLRAVGALGVDEVIVVDDGSTDGTAGEAAVAGARVLVAPAPLGKGGALEGALDRLPPADRYLLLDGDLGETAAEGARLLDALRTGADLAVGVLPADRTGGGFGLVKRFSALVIRRLSGFRPAEPLSGQRAMTHEVLEAVRPLAEGFGLETAMTVDAVRMGFRVVEVPVAMRHRPTGRTVGGFAHRGRQGAHVVRAALPRLLRWR